jgi:hypothetical protein
MPRRLFSIPIELFEKWMGSVTLFLAGVHSRHELRVGGFGYSVHE